MKSSQTCWLVCCRWGEQLSFFFLWDIFDYLLDFIFIEQHVRDSIFHWECALAIRTDQFAVENMQLESISQKEWFFFWIISYIEQDSVNVCKQRVVRLNICRKICRYGHTNLKRRRLCVNMFNNIMTFSGWRKGLRLKSVSECIKNLPDQQR